MTTDSIMKQVREGARAVETKELKHWTMVANPIHDQFDVKMSNLNDVQFWENPHVQTLTNFEDECTIVREAVQRIVMYADLDPDRGINPAIDMVNEDAHGKEWGRELFGHMTQTLHSFDRPMSSEPWTKQGTTWEDGRLETNNYTTLIGLVSRVPPLPQLRAGSRDWKGTPLGEDIPEIFPFEAKKVKKDVKETETDYTYALIAGAAAGLYVATR
jgi:hypothetical protein